MLNITVTGPGALGSYISCLLSTTGSEVQLLDYNKKRAGFLAENGIQLQINNNTETYHIPVTADTEETKEGSILILCLKSYSMQDFFEHESILAKSSGILVIQNGISWIPYIERLNLPAAVGVCYFGVTQEKPGTARFAGEGPFYLGSPKERKNSFINSLHDLFRTAGIKTLHSDNILRDAWLKMLVNGSINPLTAVYNCLNGELLDAGEHQAKMMKLIHEGTAAAESAGFCFSPDEVFEIVQETCRKTSSNVSSMLQDIRKGKRTEIEAITGEILKTAARNNIPVPCTLEIYNLLT